MRRPRVEACHLSTREAPGQPSAGITTGCRWTWLHVLRKTKGGW